MSKRDEDEYFQALTDEEREALDIVNDDCDRNEAIQRVLDGTPLYAGPAEQFRLHWGKPGIGFGTADFYWSDHEYGKMKLYCDSETMSKDFIKEMLCQMVDDSVFEDERD